MELVDSGYEHLEKVKIHSDLLEGYRDVDAVVLINETFRDSYMEQSQIIKMNKVIF